MSIGLNQLKVISGGQTGVDLAGLWAAKVAGIPTGGKAPKLWRTMIGARPELGSFFDLIESNSSYYGRTIENVVAADQTLIIAQKINSSGTKLTINAIQKHHKSSYTIDPRAHKHPMQHNPAVPIWDYVASDVSGWIFSAAKELDRPLILNIAGNSETSAPGIFEWSFLAMLEIFRGYFELLVEAGFSDARGNIDMIMELQRTDLAAQLNNKFSMEMI